MTDVKQHQILEKGKGTHEVENLGGWDGIKAQAERSQGRPYPVERDEGDLIFIRNKGNHVQSHDVAEGAEPMTRGGGGPNVENLESPSVVGGGVQRIWKGLHPRSNCWSLRVELDTGKKVPSGPWNP